MTMILLMGIGFVAFIFLLALLVLMLVRRNSPSAIDTIQMVELKKRVDDLEKKLK